MFLVGSSDGVGVFIMLSQLCFISPNLRWHMCHVFVVYRDPILTW